MNTPIRFAHKYSTRIAVAVLMTLCVLAPGLTAYAAQPKIISFDAPGADLNAGDYNGTFANGVNGSGVITGSYVDVNNVYHGFLRTLNGDFTTFDAPGADTTPNDYNGTYPVAINDLGVVAGYYWDVNSIAHGFLRKADGTFTTFDVPNSTATVVYTLNWEGAVVGFYADQNGLYRAYVRNPDGTFATWAGPTACTTDPSQGCFGTGASNINGFGAIVGGFADNSGNFVHHSFLRGMNGTLKVIDVPGAGTGLHQGTGCSGCALGFNQFGVVAGSFTDSNNVQHGFLWNHEGRFTIFDAPGAGTGNRQGTGCEYDCPTSLNDWGSITGTYIDANNVYHGYSRNAAGKIVSIDPKGSTFTQPAGINDSGVITGTYLDANNVYHGFLAVENDRR